MKEILSRLLNYERLSQEESEEVLTSLVVSPCNETQLASFLTVFMMRDIGVEELAGFRNALLKLATKVDFSDFDTIDLCGTGGDGKNTFNISTLTAFVVAGAGYKVAKHGNYGVSSASGSSNVLEALGYRFTSDEDRLKKYLDTAGLCFLHAPLFHPAMKTFAPVRKALGLKTFFNMLGPLVNPSFPNKQLTGVFNLQLARLYECLLQSTAVDYSIVYTLNGYDEIALTGKFQVINQQGRYFFHPRDLNLPVLLPEAIGGGDDVAQATDIFKKIIGGQGTIAQNQVVLANAAFAIQLFETNLPFDLAYEKAQDSLLGLKAKKCLDILLA